MKSMNTKLSKFLSLVLRHKPEVIGIQLEENGWTDVQTLLTKMNEAGKSIDLETLNAIVEADNKGRYSFNIDKTRIRANQGHSVEIDLGYQATTPPDILYHGTANRFIESILSIGLEKRNRHHVHLTADRQTAVTVGKRHGKPVILEVLAKEMLESGYEFYVSDNGVWLTDHVPVKYLK